MDWKVFIEIEFQRLVPLEVHKNISKSVKIDNITPPTHIKVEPNESREN